MKRSASGTEPRVVATGARLEKLAGGLEFAEGATCDAAGNVFFSDQPNDRILKWGVEGGLSTFLQPAGRANGMCFDAGGHLIACADQRNELWTIAPDGKVSVLVTEYGGKRLNGPNDVWVRPDGRHQGRHPVCTGVSTARNPDMDFHVRPRRSTPLGAYVANGGVNFSLFCRNATGVDSGVARGPRSPLVRL